MYLRLPLHKYLPFLLKKTGEENEIKEISTINCEACDMRYPQYEILA